MKRFFAVFSAFAVLFSVSIPVLASSPSDFIAVPVGKFEVSDFWVSDSAYDWELMFDVSASDCVSEHSDALILNSDGYCVMREDYGKSNYTVSFTGRKVTSPDIVMKVVIQSLDGTQTSMTVSTITRAIVGFGSFVYTGYARFVRVSFKVDKGFKSLKIYYGTEKPPFGTGGLSGDSSDLQYGAQLIGNIFDGLWNVVTSYWWVSAIVLLPFAYMLFSLFVRLILFNRTGRGNGKGFIGWFINRIKERRRTNLSRRLLANSNADFVKIDGHIYYNPRRSGLKDKVKVEFGNFKKGVFRLSEKAADGKNSGKGGVKNGY